LTDVVCVYTYVKRKIYLKLYIIYFMHDVNLYICRERGISKCQKRLALSENDKYKKAIGIPTNKLV